MDIRLDQLRTWLEQKQGLKINNLEPASADASFRRYFRVFTPEAVYVVMDAPPDKEPSTQFAATDLALAKLDVHVPRIHAQDLKQGFLLLEDLGSITYLDELKQNPGPLYSKAISALLKIQSGANDQGFTPPAYDRSKLAQEMDLFPTWFIQGHLDKSLSESQKTIWATLKETLIDACLNQPQVWVHRDYHSRNLMITKKNSPGVIDFQDIVVGPIAYDLASIFKDCYIEWPRDRQIEWLEEYRQAAGGDYSLDQLTRWYDLVGLQRHLKVLGIFCRLSYRDGKSQYLDDLPLVAKYCLEVMPLYPELRSFESEFSELIALAKGQP